MKICIQMLSKNSDRSLTGKGKFFKRLRAEFEKMGIEVTYDPKKKVDIDICINKPLWWPKNAKRKVIRLGPVEADSNRKDLKECWHIAKKYIKQSHGIIYQSEFSMKANHAFLGHPKCAETIILHGAPDRSNSEVAPCPNCIGNGVKGPWDYKHYYHRNFLLSTREWVFEKRLEEGIKSFLLADIPNSHLWIAGQVWDKPKRFPREQKSFRKKYRQDNIHFLGQMDDWQTSLLYKYCDAMLFLSYIDSCPNSVVEAITHGLPVISNCCGGQFEILSARSLRDTQCATIRSEEMWNFKVMNRRKQPKAHRKGYALHMRAIAENPQRIKPEAVRHVHIETIAKQYKAFFEELL